MLRLSYIGLALSLAMGLCRITSAVDFRHDGKVSIIAAPAITTTEGMEDEGTPHLSGIHGRSTVALGGYTIKGESNQTVAVVLTGSMASGLAIGSFTTNQADLNNVSLGADGSVVLTIGADLSVGSAIATTDSDRLVSFTIAITYN